MTIPTLDTYTMPEPAHWPTNKVDWTFEPERAALLIHDMQCYFLSYYDNDSALIQTLLNHIVELKRFCVANGIPVIYTAQPKEQNIADRALLNDMWGPGLNRAPELQKIVTELTPTEQDVVLDKWRYSAFQRSPLEHMLRELDRDQLVICGIYGHIGCLMTAVDAFMRDIKPFMVGDAIADFSKQEHEMALRYVATRCGMVVSTKGLITTQTAAPNRQTRLTKSRVLHQILVYLDESEDDFDPNENLIDYGLDSVHIMSLVTEWRQLGIEIMFVELAEAPTFNAWWALLETRLAVLESHDDFRSLEARV